MILTELKEHSHLLLENKDMIVNRWLSYEDVQEILKKHIALEIFKDEYAVDIFLYYLDVINDKKDIGDCPVMGQFLKILSQNNLPVHELYTICSHMKMVLIDFAFDENIASKIVIQQINYVADQNLIGIMKHYKDIIDEQNKKVFEYSIILQQYKDAIDHASIVSKTDLEGRITYVNDNFTQISGYSQEELIGKRHNLVRHEDVPSEEFKNMWKTIKSKKPWNGILQNRKKDGKTYYVNTIIFPILDKDDEIVEYMSMRHDLTELFELHHEINETQKEIIYKMGEIGETRSSETGNHVKRVAEYSRLLATKIGLGHEEVETLVTATPMHDIGKVGIPDSVLKKPGKLTSEEFEIMKSHAEIGFNILNTSERPILKAAAIVAQQHHEWWNGGGYPLGLKENDIHIYGRISAVADVFDALGSHRVYKKAWDITRIIEHFKEQKGKQFDPELTDILLNNMEEFLEVRNNIDIL